jgi:hypothetical protein
MKFTCFGSYPLSIICKNITLGIKQHDAWISTLNNNTKIFGHTILSMNSYLIYYDQIIQEEKERLDLIEKDINECKNIASQMDVKNKGKLELEQCILQDEHASQKYQNLFKILKEERKNILIAFDKLSIVISRVVNHKESLKNITNFFLKKHEINNYIQLEYPLCQASCHP